MILFVLDGSASSHLFGLLYERYHTVLLSYAMDILRSRQEAEDCVAETYLVVLELLREDSTRFEDVESRRTGNFLFTITRNKAFNSRRHQMKLKMVPYSDAMDSVSGDDLLENIQLNESKRLMQVELDKLDAMYRDPLILQYYHGCTVSEIAKITGISPSHVSVRIHRAKAYLKKALYDYAN